MLCVCLSGGLPIRNKYKIHIFKHYSQFFKHLLSHLFVSKARLAEKEKNSKHIVLECLILQRILKHKI